MSDGENMGLIEKTRAVNELSFLKTPLATAQRFAICFVLLCQFVFVSTVSMAQVEVELPERISSATKPLSEQLKRVEEKLNSGDLDESTLTKLRAELEQTTAEVLSRVNKFQPEIIVLYLTFDRLPPPPGSGEPEEALEIAQERKKLSDLKSKTLLVVKEAELLAVWSSSLGTRVLEARRAFFISSLLKQRHLDIDTFASVGTKAPSVFGKMSNTVTVWVSTIFRFHTLTLIAVLGVSALLFGFVLWVLRPLRRRIILAKENDDITPLTRITLAFFSIVVPTAAIVVLAFSLHQLLSYAGLYRFRIDQMMKSFLYIVSGFAFYWLVLRAILTPRHTHRRLVDMTSNAASKLFVLGIFVGTVFAVDTFFSNLFILFSSPVEFSIVKSLISTTLIVIALVCALLVRLVPKDIEKQGQGYRGWKPWVYWLAWLSIVAIVLTELAGYVSLGRFIAEQIIVTGTILATAYIGFQAARALADSGALETTKIGMMLKEKKGFTSLRLDQLGLVFSILINVGVVLLALPTIVLQWGYQPDEVISWIVAAVTGFSIGGFDFNIGRILLALAVFTLLIVFTRFVQRWFDGKVLQRTTFDSGLRNSIRSGLGYVGYILAALVALSWAGLNLSNIALVAGALSVGIGFGLQNIVNNFVSGLIMLIERPIRVGDIISVGAAEGYVRKINVRATELETFERQSVIIPNSEVINTSVGNWNYKDNQRRLLIQIGVAYGSDVKLVRDLLIKVTENDDRIATSPAPYVYFNDFGASSLDFQLRMIIKNLDQTLGIESDLRFRIVEIFEENNIEIPFPQQDIHVRSGLAELAPKKTSLFKK